jgi:glycogen synthase
MRIMLAPSAYYPHVGGIEELTRQLALTLASRGHDVSVLTNRWPAGVARHEVLGGVDVTRLAFPLPAARPRNAARFLVAAPGATLALLRHLRRRKPDVIHIIGAGPQSVYIGALAPLLHARLVFTAQGEFTFDAHNVFEQSATMRAGLRRVLRRADAVTACSAYVLESLTALGVNRADAAVIPNGINPDDFSPTPQQPDDRPYVLGVGRLVDQKGFDVLIDAFASPNGPSGVDVVIAGEGPARSALTGRIRDHHLTEQARLIGSVSRQELPTLLGAARAFALPSRGEPFGIALLEAMASGVPAVATASGGIPEFAVDGTNSLLVQPDDAPALAAALARVISDSALRTRLAAGGRETARELSWNAICPRYEALYSKVCGRPSQE